MTSTNYRENGNAKSKKKKIKGKEKGIACDYASIEYIYNINNRKYRFGVYITHVLY